MWLLKLFFGEERIGEFRGELSRNFSVSLDRLCSKALALGALLSLAPVTLGLFFETPTEVVIVLFAVLLFAPLLLSLLYYSYLVERRIKTLEQEAPMVLLQASVFPKGTPVSQIISYLSRKENGLLGGEFLKAKKEIAKGASIEKALGKMKRRNKSPVIGRLAEVLLVAYESGSCLGESFRELAEELLETRSILAEKKAALATERLTLFLGSALIVPFILGMLTGLVFEFDFAGIEIEGFSSAGQRAELLQNAPLANYLYIIEYAVIASVFLAWLDGKPRKAFLYALVLLPSSLVVFTLSRGLSLV